MGLSPRQPVLASGSTELSACDTQRGGMWVYHPEQKLLLIWDGASYHRGEEVKKLLAIENEGKEKEDWSITCHLFAPYAPEENPVEEIWLQVKNFIRRFYYICKKFSIVKRLFQLFFNFKLFNPPNFKNYDAFVQLI
jgi:transposase